MALVKSDSNSTVKLADFDTTEDGHGSIPNGALMRTADGNFFGLAQNGGANNFGTIFRAKATGAIKRMASFPVGGDLNGANPVDSLIQGADGALYGTTSSGGANNLGTVFKIETGLPALNQLPTDIVLSVGNITENDGVTVGALSVTDSDASQTHTFSLVAGAGDTDNTAFLIQAGFIKLADPSKPSYSIRIRALDDGTPPLAGEMQLTFSITKADQTITFNPPATRAIQDGSFALTATASSGLTVTFTRVSGPATINGNTVTPTGGGDLVVLATQAGNALYNVAPQVERTITITAPPNTAPSFTLAGEWTERRMDANDTGKRWNSVASSADGTKLAAVVIGGRIYTSTDSGVTWTARDTDRNWQQLVSSADGVKLVASESEFDTPGFIYVSSDSGVTWTQRGNHLCWRSLASSADGSKLVAAVADGGIWTSANSGLTWRSEGTGIRNWKGLASSADGSKLVVSVWYGNIYTSTDFGANFTPQPGAGDDAWEEVASSTNGAKLVAAAGSRLYTSTDSGVTWIQRLEKSALWYVASSADGSRLVTSDVVSRNPRASIYDATFLRDGRVYTSKDSGVTWTEWNLPHVIGSVASSADGTKLVAASLYGSIYTLDLSVRERRVADGAGPQTVSNFAQNLNPGPGIESVQVVDFLVSNDNSSLFSVQPALSASGTLTYTPAVGANGTATVTVRAHDNGINTGGGSDTSEAQTFTITVFPSVNLSGNRTEGLILNGQRLANISGNPITVSGATLISGNTGVARGNVTFSGPFFVSGNSTFEVKDTVTISGQMTASPAGSTFVKTGPGTLVIDGANFNGTITVLQGTVIVRGANGDTCYTVAGSSTLASSGSMRCQTVRAGSRISPGASPGSFTTLEEAVWEARSIYEWEINNAIGTAGLDPGWDKINIGSTLTLSGTVEQPGNLLSGPITIALKSLTSGNADGPMANFNNATAYSWTIASAAGGITGFNPAAIQLDTNGIANDLGGGVFTLSKPNATDLVVNFIPVAQLAAPTDIVLLGTTIAEVNNYGDSIGQLAAMDANPSDNHTYALVEGSGDTDNASFRIVGNTLQAAAVFDFETKNNYSVRVRATDAGGLFTEKEFTITVTDVVESATFQAGQIAFVDGSIQLKLQSSGNLLWRIEASSDLVTWTTVTTSTPGLDGVLNFVDPDSGSNPRRYYRAVLVPN